MTLFVRCSKFKGFSWVALIVFLLSTLTISDGNPVVDDEFLIVSVSRINTHPNFRLQTGQIYQIDLATGRSRPLFNTDPPSSPSYLAIDRKKQVLYYVVGYDEIDSVSLTQGNNDSRVIFTDPTSPLVHLNGLAVDVERQKLYLSDAGYYPRIVEIDLLDPNRTQRIIAAGHRLKPKAIVIDEVNSELYWTDLGSKPGIFVINLMQPNVRPQILISDNIVSPNALAIDFEEEVMYWSDDNLDRIEMSDLYGQDRRILVQTPIAGVYYFAMTISPQFIFITDQTTSTVLRVDRATNNITEQQMPALNGRKTGMAYYNSNFTNAGRVGRRHTNTYVAADEATTLSTSNRKTETWRRVRTFATDETTHLMTTTIHGKVEAEILVNVYYYDGEIVITLLVVLGSIFLFIVIIAIISLAIWCDRRRHRRTTGVSIAFGYSPAATVACDEVHSSRGRLLLLTNDVYVIKDNNNSDEDLPEVGMHPSTPTKHPDHLPDRME